MEKENKKRIKRIILIVSIVVIISLIGLTYAYINYMKLGQNNEIVTGNIRVNLSESSQITLNDFIPTSVQPSSSDALVFTISGTNESNRTIYYEVNVVHGNDSTTSGAIRIDDEFVSFTLEKETSADNWEVVSTADHVSFASFKNGGKLHIDTIPGNQTVSQRYRLYVWINDTVKIYGGNDLTKLDGDYSSDEMNKLYASVKVKVTGDFNNTKTIPTNLYNTLFDKDNSKGASDTTVVFSNPSGSDGKTGLYYMSSTASDEYPIYYYRGNVTTNNVVFGGYCWKIVRTTDTGGIKLIYNGEYSQTNKCVHATNNNTTTGIGTSAFNSNYKSLAHMGYSYPGTITTKDGTTRAPYEWVENDVNILSRTTVLYGADVEYNETTGKYKLKGGTVTGAPDNTHHYSLNSSDPNATDTKVRFYYYANLSTSANETDRKNYYIELTGGDNIDDAVLSMTNESVNAESTIQTVINSWYNSHLKDSYDGYIEDTIWCMDRSRLGIDGWNSGGSLTTYYYTKTYNRASSNWVAGKEPKLACDNPNDKLKYARGFGNIGSKAALLTYDEVGMAGMRWNSSTTRSDNYLYTGYWYWLLSPADFYGFGGSARAGGVSATGELGYNYVNNTSGGVRPSISLKHGTLVYNSTAAGTEADPYIVGNNIK